MAATSTAVLPKKRRDPVMHKFNTKKTLSPRELGILALIADGKCSKEIAEILFISIKTVDTHRSNMLRKLELNNALSLTVHAFRTGLLPCPCRQISPSGLPQDKCDHGPLSDRPRSS